MELWIRSQDKSCLLNIKAVIILDKVIRGYYNENPNWFLGKYDNKERALEVLDEIEAILMYKKLERITGNAIIHVDNNVAIYEMPKE